MIKRRNQLNNPTRVTIFYRHSGFFHIKYHFQITEKEEYEKAVLDVISKRRQGTKTCKDVLEKTLSLEKRAVVCESTFVYTVYP